MKYDYKCEKCKKITTIELPMKDDKPRTIKCKCGHDAYQDLSSKSLICPEHMKAQGILKKQ